MLEIKRSKNGHNYDVFDIVVDGEVLKISFQGNLDLYWSYDYRTAIADTKEYMEFNITKENYYLYLLFDELYIAIKNNKPYHNCSIKDDKLRNKKINEYGNLKLYQDRKIIWYSDDFADISNASAIIIEKKQDRFLVTIKRSLEERYSGTYFKTYSVRIRNSGSRYEPYNITFMNMYQKLKEYNPNYHQIHVEEYLYQNKIKKRLLSK